MSNNQNPNDDKLMFGSHPGSTYRPPKHRQKPKKLLITMALVFVAASPIGIILYYRDAITSSIISMMVSPDVELPKAADDSAESVKVDPVETGDPEGSASDVDGDGTGADKAEPGEEVDQADQNLLSGDRENFDDDDYVEVYDYEDYLSEDDQASDSEITDIGSGHEED